MNPEEKQTLVELVAQGLVGISGRSVEDSEVQDNAIAAVEVLAGVLEHKVWIDTPSGETWKLFRLNLPENP